MEKGGACVANVKLNRSNGGKAQAVNLWQQTFAAQKWGAEKSAFANTH